MSLYMSVYPAHLDISIDSLFGINGTVALTVEIAM
jgi:hypothetical protein